MVAYQVKPRPAEPWGSKSKHYKLYIERLKDWRPYFVCFRWYPSSRVPGRDCRTLQNGRRTSNKELSLTSPSSSFTSCWVSCLVKLPHFSVLLSIPTALPCPWTGLYSLSSRIIATSLRSLAHRKHSVNIGCMDAWMGDGWWLGEWEGKREGSRGKEKMERKKERALSYIIWMDCLQTRNGHAVNHI